MAARRNSPKLPLLLAVLVAACGCASARASPEPLPLPGFGGFGGFLGSGPGDTSEAPSTTPRSRGGGIVGSVVGAIGSLGGRRPSQQQQHGHIGEVTEAAHLHPHSHTTTTTTTTTSAPAPSTRAPSTAAVSTTTTSTTSTTASPSSSPATAATAAKNQQAVQTGERSGEAVTTSTPRPTTFTPQQEICRKNWQEVGNETINNNIDVLSILLDYGGIPGQVGAHNWTRNTTDPRDPTKQDPDRWTYFYGNSDYQTFIRVERGSIHSKQLPAERAVPEEVRGDFWWAPKDFCGKLRHAKYYLDADPEITDEVCWISEGKLLSTRDFNCIEIEGRPPGEGTCGRGGLNGALMASLVG